MRDKNTILVESIRRLLRRGATANLKKIINKTHGADLSEVFRSLSIGSQKKLFDMIEDLEQKGVLLSELEENLYLDFIKELETKDLVQILEQIPSDDVAVLVDRMPPELADEVLEKMGTKESEEVEDLLSYDDASAGRIMTPDFVAVGEELTCREVLESFQTEHVDAEVAFYVYVVDEYERLVGVISLRQLVVEKPASKIRDFMTTDIFSVQTEMDQEEVAKIVEKYDILAVPVVDDSNVLVGIVTVDDVIDVLRKEATEDILKMAGAGQEFVETQTVLSSTRIRLPWLFASCIGGILALFIIGIFEKSLAEYTFLAAFIPVIMGMGGNIATQSSAIVVRGLATGRYNPREFMPVVLLELSTGAILGLVYGVLIAMVAQFQYSTVEVAISVGLGVFISMSVAALVGSFIPMMFARINIDPAVAAGPFVTTTIDIISVYFYFKIATTLLGI